MAKILLIESNLEIRELYKKNIIKNFNYEVVDCYDVQSALKVLIANTQFDLIFVRDQYTGVNNIGVLVSYLKKNNLEIPLGIVGEISFNYNAEILFSPMNTWKKNLYDLSSILNVILSDAGMLNLTDFQSVPLCYFYQINKSIPSCDVFILKDKENNETYEILFGSKEKFDRLDIESLKDSGVDHFYVEAKFRDSFLQKSIEETSDKFFVSLELIDLVQLCSDSFDIARDIIEREGMNDDARNLLFCTFEAVKKISESSDFLQKCLKKEMKLFLSYGFLRYLFMALIAQKIFPTLGFVNTSSLEKFLYLSLLHDISINNDQWLEIHSEDQLKKSNFSKVEIEVINRHANVSAEIISDLDSIPPGITDLILEHHGQKNGIGFRDHLSISTSPIMMIFIVVEDVVVEILKHQNSINQREFEEILNKKTTVFNKLNYKDTLDAIKLVIKF